MRTETHNNADKKFITILADGKFHETVEDGTPGSVVREYEDKEGVMQKKVELVHDALIGKITKVSFEEGKFGKSIQIELDGEGVISASIASNFGEDIMKKLPALDLAKEVKFAPYAFEAGGKSKKGVTVYQDGNKVESFYYNADTKKSTNGFPEPEGDTKKFDSDDWKMYFMKVRKFLAAKTEERFPQEAEQVTEEAPKDPFAVLDEQIASEPEDKF